VIRVIIADDHHLIRRGFRQYIERIADMHVTAEAGTGAELLQMCSEERYDIILLDISLPDRHGLEVLKDVKSQCPAAAVLILSMHPEEMYAKRALENGASGYITKGSSPEDLERAIRKVFNGGTYVSETLAEELAVEIGEGRAEPLHQRLSDREFQVLVLLGSGWRAKDIADSLHLSLSTVHTYKQRIMEKLSLHSTAELFQYVYSHDLLDSCCM
jgi:DNA-binding NarL/FixJ family response regulator